MGPVEMSDPRTIGVECEVRVLDAYGRETNVPLEILGETSKTVRQAGPLEIPGFTHVLMPVPERTQSVVEVTTRPVSVNEISGLLTRMRSGANSWAREHGYGVLFHSTGLTRPVGGFQTTNARRYRSSENRLRDSIAQLHTSGFQPHYGTVDDADERVAIANGYGPIEHVLLAMFAASPYFEGRDTGFASRRYTIFDQDPTAEHLPTMTNSREYEAYVSSRIATIQPFRFGGGVADATFAHSWTRPTRHRTIETRIPDMPLTMRESLLLSQLAWSWGERVRCAQTGGARQIIRRFSRKSVKRGRRVLPDRSSADRRLASWQAARDGLNGTLVHPATWQNAPASDVVRFVVGEVEPVLRDYEMWDEFVDGIEALLARGNGARRLREAHAAIHRELLERGVAASRYPLAAVVRGNKLIPAVERRALTAYVVAAGERDDLTTEAQPTVRARTEAIFEQYRRDPRGLDDGMDGVIDISAVSEAPLPDLRVLGA